MSLRFTQYTINSRHTGGLLILLAMPSMIAVVSLAVASISGFVSTRTMGEEGATVRVSTLQQDGVQVGDEPVCFS